MALIDDIFCGADMDTMDYVMEKGHDVLIVSQQGNTIMVDSSSKGNKITVDCAPVERTRWRTTADSSGCGHEKVETH